MSYSPYYPNKWQSGEAGATPITPAALNYMEDGIADAHTAAETAASAASTAQSTANTANTTAKSALPKAGGTMTGTVTMKGIKLTSGTDYGSTLPSSPAVGQLFFLDADKADELGL